LFDVGTMKKSWEVSSANPPVLFSPDGQYIVCQGDDRAWVVRFTREKGTLVNTIPLASPRNGLEGAPNGIPVALSSDNRRLVSADKLQLMLWEFSSGLMLRSLRPKDLADYEGADWHAHVDDKSAVRFNRRALTIEQWDLVTGNILKSVSIGDPNRLPIDQAGQEQDALQKSARTVLWENQLMADVLAPGTILHKIVTMDITTGAKKEYNLGGSGGVLGKVHVSHDGQSLLAALSFWDPDARKKWKLMLWNINDRQEKTIVVSEEEHAWCGGEYSLSPDGKRVAFRDDGRINIFDASIGTIVAWADWK
jgi:WD40 repeat protein